MFSKQVGNTSIVDSNIYRGSPFPTLHVNSGVLERVFPDGKIEISKKDNGEKSKVICNFKQKGEEIEARPIRYEIIEGEIGIIYNFPPQSLDELGKNIFITENIQKNIETELLKAYGLKKSPDLYSRKWIGESEHVPCVKWLKKQITFTPNDINFQNYLKPKYKVDMRVVCTSIFFHVLPPNAENLPKDFQRKLEITSGFQISVGTAANWEEGVAKLSANLYDISPMVYIEILNSVIVD